MPLPTPRDDEDRQAFLDRCMGDDTMREEFPDDDQRFQVCRRQYGEAPDDDSDESRLLSVDTRHLGAPRLFRQLTGAFENPSLTDGVWAVQDSQVLKRLAAIAQRQGSMEAVERFRSHQAEDAFDVSIRNGVAIIPIHGPIFPRASLFTMVSGATSIDVLARDLQQMVQREDVRAIMLHIDSPGGAVTDVDEMAGIIADVARQKRVVSYINGTAASAAYWLATAATEIVSTRTGAVGGIGVVATVPKQQEPNEQGMMDFDIVSSNAPDKRPDPETNAGRQAILDRIDPIERTFVETVATNRGVSVDTVRQDFGQGNVIDGQSAVDLRMVDRLGTYEGVLNELQQVQFPTTGAAASVAHSQPQTSMEDQMSDEVEGTAEAQTSANERPDTAPQTASHQPEPATAAAPADQVVERCNNAGFPQLAPGLIRQGATMEAVQQRLSDLTTIRDRCNTAAQDDMISSEQASEIINAAVRDEFGPDKASTMIFEKQRHRASADTAVQSQFSPDASGDGSSSLEQLAAEDVQERRQRAKARGQNLVTFADLEA